MAINVAATPLAVTNTLLATEAFGVVINPALLQASLQLKQVVISHSPPAVRDKDLDLTWYMGYSDSTEAAITLSLSGTWESFSALDTALVATLTLGGEWVASEMLAVGPQLDVTMTLLGDVTVELPKSNWVMWSNIGALDFTVWKDNVAGARPLDWEGWIYAIRKLEKSVVVYGSGGVSLLIPDYTRWGLKTLSRIGVRRKLAICGNDFIHFYVDAKDRLCKVTDKLEILGYDEYIGTLSHSLVLSYDEHLQRVFICDGQYGYVYSVADKSLGRGPGNVTGWSPNLTVSAGAITSTPFEICTDIYDLGTRKDKTIMEVELGVDASNEIYVAIDWRKDKTAAFATTPWTRVNPNGKANLPCWGREFRIRIKMLSYEEFKLDYIKVLGQLHNYSFLDSFLRGRQV